MSVNVTLWGVRGSIATPGPGTTRHGGNTPCVVLETDGRVLILDAGTGIRGAGEWLIEERPDVTSVDVLLSHTHWDHIQGLPFFAPLYLPRYSVAIRGPDPDSTTLEAVLERQMDPVVFPVPLTGAGASVTVQGIVSGPVAGVPWEVLALDLHHPVRTLGYRVAAKAGGPTMAYVTDNELGGAQGPASDGSWYPGMVAALQGIDVLIHDAMYRPDIIDDRVGWGHSTPTEALELAAACGASHLLLFHHDPNHDDRTLDGIVEDTRQAALARGLSLTIDAAREGQTLRL